MNNLIRVGVRQACLLELLEDVSEYEATDGVAYVRYGAPRFLPNLQKIDLTPNTQETDVDADDTTMTLAVCSGYDGTVTRNSFEPDEQAWILGEKKIGDIVVSTNNDKARRFALGFKSILDGETDDSSTGQTYLYMMVLKVKFSQDSFSAESKGNKKLNPQADALNFSSSSRNADGSWRFYARSSDPEFGKTFFTQETAQMLAETASRVNYAPAEVVFTDTLSDPGKAGIIYICENTAYYWDGSNFIKKAENSSETESTTGGVGE